jgi:hypothetical protein
MRGDAELAHARISRQDNVDRRRQVARAPLLLEEMGDRRRADRLPRQGLGQGRIEGAGADVIKQSQEARGLGGQGGVAGGDGPRRATGSAGSR